MAAAPLNVTEENAIESCKLACPRKFAKPLYACFKGLTGSFGPPGESALPGKRRAAPAGIDSGAVPAARAGD
jgi:hypothetical protein